MQAARFLIPALFLTTLVACGSAPRKQYIDPEEPAAQECVTECGVMRTRCRAQAYDYYEMCRREYEWRERQHAACVRQGGTFCIKPERCRPPQTEICTNQYDGCYQACGGIIETGSDQ